MADFPAAIPAFTDLNGALTLAANNHAARHNKVHAEVDAIATKVGVDSSTDHSSMDYKLATAIGSIATNATTMNAHIANTSNPHAVTKSQVSLGNVDNTSDATKNSATATLTNKSIDGGSNTITGLTTSSLASAAVTAAKINFGGSGSGVWWEEIGRATASSTVADLTATLSASRKYLSVILTVVPTSGFASGAVRFNNDSATNYAYRTSDNGSADASGSFTGVPIDTGATSPTVVLGELMIIDISGQEKIVFGHIVDAGAGTGIANAPKRRETQAKWTGTANITNVILHSSLTNLGAGTEIIILGHN